LFSGSEDPVGQQLRGLHKLIARYRDAGLSDIAFDFYPGGRHEMLNEINRRAGPNPPAQLDFPNTGKTERR
jgi:alpha-beta hydrolase superfamily lysophospholipase